MVMRSLLRFLSLMPLMALLWGIGACTEQAAPATVFLLDLSPGVKIVTKGGAQQDARQDDEVAIGRGMSLLIPRDGFVFLVVRETSRVTYLTGESQYAIDELLILEEPPTDTSVKDQLEALKQQKRSPTVSDARVAAFHQGVRSAVTIGHEVRRPSKPMADSAQAERAPAPSSVAEEEVPATSDSERAASAVKGAPGGQVASSAEEARNVGASGKGSARNDARVAAPSPTKVVSKPAVQRRAVGKADNKKRKAKAAAPSSRVVDVEERASEDGRLGIGGGGGGAAAPMRRTRGGPVAAPGAGEQASPATLTRDGIEVVFEGEPVAQEASSPSLKATHIALARCRAVKRLSKGQSLRLLIVNEGGKVRLGKKTSACVRKALLVLGRKLPADTRLTVIVRLADGGR
jgi:hypothetical protein